MLELGKVDLGLITELWSYKTFFANGAKYCVESADSQRYCNSIVSKDNEQYVLKKVLLLSFGDNRAKCALVFVNKISVKKLKINPFVLKVDKIENGLEYLVGHWENSN